MIQTILKGILLAVVFGGISFVFTKDIGMSGLIGLVMFMSMFVKPKQK